MVIAVALTFPEQKPAELPRRAFFIRRLAIVRGDLADKAVVAGSAAGSVADSALPSQLTFKFKVPGRRAYLWAPF
jgi:hypothetical protein